jgi:CheY-like chemotaxis protein
LCARSWSDYVVDVAKDGVEALARVKERQYDAIICDILMPNMNGIEFYTELREVDAAQAERVMFVTGMDMDEDLRRRIRETGRPVLHKPFEIGTFTAAVGRVARGEE